MVEIITYIHLSLLLYLFADDQVRVPQVRFFWYGGETGRAVRAPPQHHQREDLRLPLVLVRRCLPHHGNTGTVSLQTREEHLMI